MTYPHQRRLSYAFLWSAQSESCLKVRHTKTLQSFWFQSEKTCLLSDSNAVYSVLERNHWKNISEPLQTTHKDTKFCPIHFTSANQDGELQLEKAEVWHCLSEHFYVFLIQKDEHLSTTKRSLYFSHLQLYIFSNGRWRLCVCVCVCVCVCEREREREERDREREKKRLCG